jgi:hypothetical protein
MRGTMLDAAATATPKLPLCRRMTAGYRQKNFRYTELLVRLAEHWGVLYALVLKATLTLDAAALLVCPWGGFG